MKVYFATWLVDWKQGETMTKKKAFKRLLSYFFLESQSISQEGFTEYIKTGSADIRKKKDE